uniref:Uncharacterized protein n=1 Tax=Anguilla anguilla TaxID=7936 RepID=A0A0E9P6Q4_ANGAN
MVFSVLCVHFFPLTCHSCFSSACVTH